MSAQPRGAREVFLAAIEMHPPAVRSAFVEQACGHDADLRNRVKVLLLAHDDPGSLLKRALTEGATVDQFPASDGAATDSGTVEPGTSIGPYKLLQEIGEGGMGVVFMAEQDQPIRRRVALKVIKRGMDSRQVVARFEAERQALAMMDHLNIARVLDAGATSTGQPYFVMELIHGVSITRYCDDNRLGIRERLELFIPVCQAIQHAHQKGVIHRDIKPSNVLVTLYDGRPVPKVIDFGIAKATEQRLTDRTMFTQFGGAIGTLEYMSPEQAEISALGVDTRSDVYSLGVLLYELITGTTPLVRHKLQQAGLSEQLRMIREEEAKKPSARVSGSDVLPKIAHTRKTEATRLTKLVKGELDWIVMKCLEKDRTRRYETANALARDVQRHLEDESVEACPPSAGYRLRRFARKNWKGVAATAAFVLLLLGAVVVSSWLALRATRAETQMEEDRNRAQVERDRAQLGLTRQVAARIDGELRRLSLAGNALRTTVELADDRNKDYKAQLERFMSAVLEKDEQIFGLTLGFDPWQFKGKQRYCLYVSRKTGKIGSEELGPKYDYQNWDWYKKSRQDKSPRWGNPDFDRDGADRWIVVYSMPLVRKKTFRLSTVAELWTAGFQANAQTPWILALQTIVPDKSYEAPPFVGDPMVDTFVGVLTVDLELDGLSDLLQNWLKNLIPGQQTYGFLVSDKGDFISHPAYRATPDVKALPTVASVYPELAKQLGQDSIVESFDTQSGKQTRFVVAQIPSAGWKFVTVIEQTLK